jgi:hypothetical protein
MTTRKPTENQLRALADVGNGKVLRTGAGWLVGSGAAEPGTARALNTARAHGWITAEGRAGVLDELGSEPAALTTAGRAILQRHWPDWTPTPAEESSRPPVDEPQPRRVTYTGVRRNGQTVAGQGRIEDLAAWVEQRYRQRWRSLVVRSLDTAEMTEVGGIFRDDRAGRRIWWADGDGRERYP